MPDLLVKLYELPGETLQDKDGAIDKFQVRRAMAYEKHQIVEWVREHFGMAWASECDVAFANHPISCFIAVENGQVVGFACYDATCRGFFGPIGVAERLRKKGVGRALLLSTLRAMSAVGYAYAVIGGAGESGFYKQTVGATEIPGSSPGIYRDRLKALHT